MTSPAPPHPPNPSLFSLGAVRLVPNQMPPVKADDGTVYQLMDGLVVAQVVKSENELYLIGQFYVRPRRHLTWHDPLTWRAGQGQLGLSQLIGSS